MTKEEALTLALEALEKKAGSWGVGQESLNSAAITAIKEALSQPEYQSTAEKSKLEKVPAKGTLLAQPEQEPVLQDIEQYRLQMAGISTAAIGYWKEGDGIHPDYDTLALRDVAKLYSKYDELYKAQPEQEPVGFAVMERPWVGLTGQERALVASVSLDVHDAVHRTEARLKDKNT